MWAGAKRPPTSPETTLPTAFSQTQFIPDGVTQVRVWAHDMVDGFGGRKVVVDLTVGSGSDFEVESTQ